MGNKEKYKPNIENYNMKIIKKIRYGKVSNGFRFSLSTYYVFECVYKVILKSIAHQ